MIKIICVGKIKEKFYVDALNEYKKRLSKYTKLEIIELQDSDILKEKELILKNINFKDYNIALAIEGKEYNSVELSSHIDKIQSINSNITFIIGGSDGLDNEIKNKVNELISFSKLTFPHQLFRIILLEQIYRSFKINNNETYHKWIK